MPTACGRCWVIGLMVRLGRDRAAAALTEKHTAVMAFIGRVIRTMIYVSREGIKSDDALAGRVEKAVFSLKPYRQVNDRRRGLSPKF